MEWGRSHKPSVIVLSVEPKKVGYAICNKLRRSPSLREVPLVLMSSEETQAVLDQHKKLKAHADEYMLKPFNGKDLLVKIGGLLKLNLSAAAADEDEVHELDADSDIVMADDDDADIVSSASTDENDEEEATLAVDPANYGIVAESANARDTSEQHVLPEDNAPAAPFEGEKFDPATQAAFAALEAGSPETAPPNNEMVDLRNLWNDDDLPPNLALEKAPETQVAAVPEAVPQATDLDPDVYRTGETLGPEPIVSDALLASALAHTATTAEHDAPPAPDDIGFEDVSTEASGRIISESFGAAPGRARGSCLCDRGSGAPWRRARRADRGCPSLSC